MKTVNPLQNHQSRFRDWYILILPAPRRSSIMRAPVICVALLGLLLASGIGSQGAPSSPLSAANPIPEPMCSMSCVRGLPLAPRLAAPHLRRLWLHASCLAPAPPVPRPPPPIMTRGVRGWQPHPCAPTFRKRTRTIAWVKEFFVELPADFIQRNCFDRRLF